MASGQNRAPGRFTLSERALQQWNQKLDAPRTITLNTKDTPRGKMQTFSISKRVVRIVATRFEAYTYRLHSSKLLRPTLFL